MTSSLLNEIQLCEQQLMQAMLDSDVEGLDRLLAPDLVFTNHLGHVMSKADDLAAHRSGILRITKIELSDLNVKIEENIAIVFVQAYLAGQFAGETSAASYRFTRVWRKTIQQAWQVIAAHSSRIV